MARKSFNEKLQDRKDMPIVKEVSDPRAVARYGGTKMLIAPPLAYDGVMRTVPEGKLITADRVRDYLAELHDADYTCPLTAGIFNNVAANASAERETDKIPYWRTLKTNGELNIKYPGGIQEHKAHLELEGHTVIQRGKRYFVQDFADNLMELG